MRPVYNRPHRIEFLFPPERRHLYLRPLGPGTRSVFLPGENRAPLANSCSQDACDLLVPGQARPKDCAFLSGRRDFFPRPLGPGTSSSFPLIENRAAATDFGVPDTKVLAQICHTRLSPTSKLPFFVGAGGFEPPASWSRKKMGPSFRRKSGGFEAKRVHTAHTVHEVSKKLA